MPQQRRFQNSVNILRPYAIFDFDGTLVDSNGTILDYILLFFTQHGLSASPEFIEVVKTMRMDQFFSILNSKLGKQYNPSYVKQEFNKKLDDFYYNEVQLKPFAGEYVRFLYSKGVRLCIASCSEEHQIRHALTRLNLLHYFDFIATIDQSHATGKNDPMFFQEVVAKFREPDGSRCTLYDDALQALLSAQFCKIKTVAIRDIMNLNQMKELKQHCDLYIESFSELL